jgi:hypothetical protein
MLVSCLYTRAVYMMAYYGGWILIILVFVLRMFSSVRFLCLYGSDYDVQASRLGGADDDA